MPSAYHWPGEIHKGLFCEGHHPEGLRRGLSLLLVLMKKRKKENSQNKQKLSSLASSDTAAVAPSTNVSPCNVLQPWSVLTVLH